MSAYLNVERRDTYMSQLADEMDAYAEEQQKLADLRADEINRVHAFIKSLRIDHEMAAAVLEALSFAAMRDKVLFESELSVLDDALSFIGGRS